jgi:hypothetical protein
MESGAARFEGGAAIMPVLRADGAVQRWSGRFTLIRDARGTPAAAAAMQVRPLPGDPPLFRL